MEGTDPFWSATIRRVLQPALPRSRGRGGAGRAQLRPGRERVPRVRSALLAVGPRAVPAAVDRGSGRRARSPTRTSTARSRSATGSSRAISRSAKACRPARSRTGRSARTSTTRGAGSELAVWATYNPIRMLGDEELSNLLPMGTRLRLRVLHRALGRAHSPGAGRKTGGHLRQERRTWAARTSGTSTPRSPGGRTGASSSSAASPSESHKDASTTPTRSPRASG